MYSYKTVILKDSRTPVFTAALCTLVETWKQPKWLSTEEWIKKKWSKSLSRVRLFATPWTVAHLAPLSMGFSRQEYWSGLPFPSPGDLPDPGIEPRSSALQADTLTSEPRGKSKINKNMHLSWTVRRWNQSILKNIKPEYSLEGLMLKLKLQYFEYLMWRADSLEKTLMLERLGAGGEGDNRGWGG